MRSFSIKQKFSIILLLLACIGTTANAQKVKRTEPVWWFGESVAGNGNIYRGTTQVLNNSLTVPTAFHNGEAIKTYLSLLTEYRPNKQWGGILNIAYDDRGGKFNQVMAPCNCAADLSTNISYLTIEPSLRFAPFSSAFYVFAGPSFGINLTKSFNYLQEKQIPVRADWSDIRKTVLSAQVGAGIDVPVSSKKAIVQMVLSPFASFQTDLGQRPRTVEDWSFYTVRAGIALKLGKGKTAIIPPPAPAVVTPLPPATMAAIIPIQPPVVIIQKEIQPALPPATVTVEAIRVNETFPLLNTVFFETGSTDIPGRYITLNPQQAALFSENQLLQQPDNLIIGRSSKQMVVYHNILNIIGSRMRAYPQTSISLEVTGKNQMTRNAMAESIRQYMTNQFGIDAARINVESVPNKSYSNTTSLLKIEEENRVNILTTSSELLAQFGETEALKSKSVSNTAEQYSSTYSVLFGFDKSELTGSDKKFITQTVSALIPSKAIVTIFGYADIIGPDIYNRKLSKARIKTVQQLLEQALTGKEIQFKTYGFGNDSGIAPFANRLPEERFYNRTIMINIEGGR